MLVSVNGVDITEHINKSNYSMNSSQEYESWQDGNFVEHRIVVRDRVKGSFEVALYGKDDVKLADFLTIWNGAVNNSIVTLAVWVENENRFKAIDAYYKMSGNQHTELLNGDYLDRVKIEVQER